MNDVPVHLNDQRAFGMIIPFADGIAVRFAEPVATAFPEMLAAFWRQFQRGGPFSGHAPTNRQYGAALHRALLEAGCEQHDANIMAGLAAREREQYGLDADSPVPVVPEG
jgi:hypothetical protein